MTGAEFLAKAWRVANDKARELGWIVSGRDKCPSTLPHTIPILGYSSFRLKRATLTGSS